MAGMLHFGGAMLLVHSHEDMLNCGSRRPVSLQ